MPLIHIITSDIDIKNKLIDRFIKKKYIIIYDLDKIIYNILNKSLDFTEYKKCFKTKDILIKKNEKQFILYFKNYINQLLNKLNTNDNYIILIGHNIFFNNITTYFNFNYKIKIFYNNEFNINQIINNNIKIYCNEIMNGDIPINIINHNDITKKYIKYVENIKNENYIFLDNINDIIKIINKKILISTPDKLYYASYQYFDDHIELNVINTYINIWLSIISIFGNKIIKINNNNNFTLKDPQGLLKYSKKNIYIYQIEETENFIPIVNNKYVYKYYTNNKCKFTKRIQINDLKSVFIDLKIKIIN